MSRYFMIQSWVGSHENEPDYNGQQCGERNVRSIESVPLYDQFGNANVSAFSDDAIAARSNSVKKLTKVPLKNRILPQSARVDKLRSEAIELEAAFKAGEFSAEEYTLLRSVAFRKLNRAEELLKRAVKPVEKVEDEAISYASNLPNPPDNNGHGESYSSPVGVRFIDELSDENSFKSFLQIACKVCRKAVHYKHKISSYLQTLKEV